MNASRLIARLESAREAIALAEEAIEMALGEIPVAPRAHKVAMGYTLEGAFAKLRAARAELLALEGEISESGT